jgi:hypothetical protein
MPYRVVSGVLGYVSPVEAGKEPLDMSSLMGPRAPVFEVRGAAHTARQLDAQRICWGKQLNRQQIERCRKLPEKTFRHWAFRSEQRHSAPSRPFR